MRKTKIIPVVLAGVMCVSVLVGCNISDFDPTIFMAEQNKTDGENETTENNSKSEDNINADENGNTDNSGSVETTKADSVVKVIDIRNDDSIKNMISLYNTVNSNIMDDSIRGVVVEVPSEIIEETAYFLDLTINSGKPVVVICPEDRTEIYDTAQKAAIAIAEAPESQERGTLVISDGKIYQAVDFTEDMLMSRPRFTVKVTIGIEEAVTETTAEVIQSATESNAYNSLVVGTVSDNTVVYKNKVTTKNTDKSKFDISEIKELGQVTVIYESWTSQSDIQMEAAFDDYDGIVIASAGNGIISSESQQLLKGSKNKPVTVRASRNGGNAVRNQQVNDDELGTVAAGTLTVNKARIKLMLVLSNTKDITSIQNLFANY